MQYKESSLLEQVEQAFIDWRAQRRNRSEAIPPGLWEKAVRLYPTYKTSVICQRLRLSGRQLRQHLLASENSTDLPEDLAQNPFVIAKMPKVTAPQALASFTLKTSGRELSLQIPCDYVGQIFPHMAGLL